MRNKNLKKMYKNGVIRKRGNQRVRERKIKENLMLRRPGNKDSSQMLALWWTSSDAGNQESRRERGHTYWTDCW